MRDLQPLKLELLELTKFRSVLADYYAATNLMLLLELKFNMHDPMPTEISLGMSPSLLLGCLITPEIAHEDGTPLAKNRNILIKQIFDACQFESLSTFSHLMERPKEGKATLSLAYVINQLETKRGTELVESIKGNAINNIRVIREKRERLWKSASEVIRDDMRNPYTHGDIADLTKLHVSSVEKQYNLADKLVEQREGIREILQEISTKCFGERKQKLPTDFEYWQYTWSNATDHPVWCFNEDLYPPNDELIP